MTAPIATAPKLLALANVQMAAEARLDRFNTSTPSGLRDALVFGNERSSKFTPTAAAAFATEWIVVDHQTNTGSGFSGTLFRFDGVTDPTLGVRSCLLPAPSSHQESEGNGRMGVSSVVRGLRRIGRQARARRVMGEPDAERSGRPATQPVIRLPVSGGRSAAAASMRTVRA
jgi:hypothetical protein